MTYFLESLTDWMVWINLEDAVQVILLEHRDARVRVPRLGRGRRGLGGAG